VLDTFLPSAWSGGGKEVEVESRELRELRRHVDREMDRVHVKLDTILRAIIVETQMTEKAMSAMSDAVDDLSEQVEANTSAEKSASDLISKLATLITENAADPAAVRDLAGRLKASADALAAAVVANTPAA
jgi:predicted  nucleic acid-binding Zn-ribbon protein